MAQLPPLVSVLSARSPHTLRHHADCLIMPTLQWAVPSRAPQPDESDVVNAA